MSTIFLKNLLKCLPTTTASSHPLNLEAEHAHLLPQPTIPTTASAVTDSTATEILMKNINSIYDLSSASTSKSLSTPSTYSFSSDSDSDVDSPPDLAAVFASHRFFFSSPGRSNSIIESPERPPAETQTPLNGGVAVNKYSPDPYTDFKHSMQEMIEARKLRDVRANWDYLHELLSCYLNLNPKHTHKFIISAFADIVICLLSSSPPEPETLQKPEACRRQHNVSRWLV